MFKEPKKLFVFLLLGIIVVIVDLLPVLLLVNIGAVGSVVALILIVLTGLGILYLVVKATQNLIKCISDVERVDFGFHIFNIIFAIFTVILFIALYFSTVLFIFTLI